MKYLSYIRGNVRSFGVMTSASHCVDLPAAARLFAGALGLDPADPFPQTLDDALRKWDAVQRVGHLSLAGSFGQREREAVVIRIADVKVDAPVRHPSKIVAVGLNYMDHCREQKVEPPEIPLLFTKFPSAIIGPGETIRWNERLTHEVDFEAELAVLIGRKAANVSVAHALEYVAGYTALNDVSARDLQFGDKQWVRGKSLDSFCPMGPVLVSGDEIGNPNELAIRCMVNGVVYQDSSTQEMIFSVADLIAFITQAITLEPGDVIATGTPHGVGVFRKPQVFLKNGDNVVVSVEKIGELSNRVETFSAEVAMPRRER
jgi:2-keto-4-pentenoate hydratase/2-oxohepta-3-ene-1,7-dioic acid hydratase in catechol pathway